MAVKFWLYSAAISFFILCTSCAVDYQSPQVHPKQVKTLTDSSAQTNERDTSCSYFYYLWGKTAELNGPDHFNEAREAYEKALVCDEDAGNIMLDLATLLVRMGKRQQASVWLERIIAKKQYDSEAKSILGNLYIAMGDYEEASKIFEDILQKEPDNYRAMLLLGSMYARAREYGKARKILENLVAKDNNSYIGHQYLAKLYRELGYYDKAISSYNRALELNWSDLLAYEFGDLLEYLQKYDQAEELYNRLLDEDPAAEKARIRLANILLQQDKVESALNELEELKEYSIEPQKVDLTIGRILLENENYDKAIKHFRMMLAENEDMDTVRQLLAVALHEKGDREGAIRELQKVPPEAKDYEDSVLLMARFLKEAERYREAENVLRQAMSGTENGKPSYYVALAAIYREKKKVDQAKDIFKKAVGLFPENLKLLFEYGMFLDRIGEMAEAMKTIQQILEKDPNDPYALNYVGYTWADQGVNLDRALEYLIQAVNIKPEDGFIRDSLGWVYFRLGEPERAVAELLKATDLEAEDPTIWEHLGDAYQSLDQSDKAAEAYRNAIEYVTDEQKKQQLEEKIKALNL